MTHQSPIVIGTRSEKSLWVPMTVGEETTESANSAVSSSAGAGTLYALPWKPEGIARVRTGRFEGHGRDGREKV